MRALQELLASRSTDSQERILKIATTMIQNKDRLKRAEKS